MPNILIIKQSALGDFVQALGPMAAIRKHHKDAKITLLTTTPFAALAHASGYVDDVIIDTKPRWHEFPGWLSLRRKLNDGNFTRVYDLQNSDRTSFYFKLFKKSPEWVGIAPGASHRNTSPQRTAGVSFDGHVQTLALAGVGDIAIDDLSWVIPAQSFPLPAPYVLLVPGASARHPGKRWPVAHYAALAIDLRTQGFFPVIIGAEQERALASQIRNACPAAIDLTGKTNLFDLPAIARGAAGAIGNDTGPMHMIAPTGCPSLVLFSGLTNPVRHRPAGANVRTLQQKNIADLTPAMVLSSFKSR